jgi:hypothetical protein
MADLLTNLTMAAGAAGGENLYVEDVFSTYLYTGNGATGQTIVNGIDLDGEGGMLWIKNRGTSPTNHAVQDTLRGRGAVLKTNNGDGASGEAPGYSVTSFNSNGFSLGENDNANVNTSAGSYVSWTFRKAEKFFDVVTYTGNGTSDRTVSHNLGSVPGCIIVKKTSAAGEWYTYHRSLTSASYYLMLDSTAGQNLSNNVWSGTAPTSTTFTVGKTDTNATNASGATYVAYLFAHDAGGFGDDGLQNVISCGTFTGAATVNLGYEPQWVLIKRTDSTGNWRLVDNMRGFPVSGNPQELRPNTSDAETSSGSINVNATGFKSNLSTDHVFIYIAIRRGPMKTPTAGTEVFTPSTRAGTGATATTTNLTFPPDLVWSKGRDNGGTNSGCFDRLRGTTKQLSLNQADGETTASTSLTGFDRMTGYTAGADNVQLTINATGYNYANWQFRRAPGFFDVVCYTGTGSATTFNHNLGVVPELMIVKKRSASDDWGVYAGDNTDFLLLNTTAATADDNTYWNDTSPTSTVFSVGTNADVNTSAATYVAYLFASLAGVSKIGTYTGNGSSVTVTTGFQPRFILVKRTDSTGNWILGDSARGLVAADEPALFLNSTAAETTGQDWVDISATGFTVNETALNANVSTATYIYLCVS